MEVQAIIPAAGAGLHNGESSARVLMPVGGRSLIRRTLEAFDQCPEITGIIVMVSQRNLVEVTRELEADGWRKPIDIQLGGERRQDSVRMGLESLRTRPPDFVLVHDGARPLVSDNLIHQGLETARQYGAATAAVPVHHTYKHVDSKGFVHGTVERADLMQIQTPQVFRFDWILEAHEKAVRERIVVEDDAELIEKLGKPVKVFSGSYSNLKVATREDALMVEALLAAAPVCV
ncbi:MAG: 2-C-methyl-D-erythritol 4-phosphate cytidylyltransferase [Candidatus Dormibacteraeota bacterium]|nr:2-C-methyl-D-erythritol 4-phosphate cytidylyltransferase [Candidatus Dormibacteraeota bacterium]